MKKTIFTFIISVVLAFTTLLPTVCYANYGATIPTDVAGTRADIITIKRPESLSACTSDKTYTISATGAQGTIIKIYKVDAAENVGKLVTSERQIGASGLYSSVVELNDDNNIFIVYAEKDGGSQIVNVSINKIKKSTIDRLKNVTVTIRNFLR